MKALKVFIFGLLYGWFAKSAIDRVYRDNKIEDIRSENASLKETIRALEARLRSKELESRAVQQPVAPSQPRQGDTGQDDLKVIKGIGPAIEKKLNGAGILTFEALARLTVEELETILGSTTRLVKDKEILIAQAKTLAGQKDK